MRTFAGIDLGREAVPDATTLLHFRHLLEREKLHRHDLCGSDRLPGRTPTADARGHTGGCHPDSRAEFAAKERETPRWRQVRKGNPWYFGLKGHIGADAASGSLNETMAHPREVFWAAVIGGAYAVVWMHNHPSGDPEPSNADRIVTQQLVEAGQILRISIADHVIVGQKRHFSFKEAGLI